MTNNRIKLYWLLLSVLIFTASVLTTIGESQARYVSTAAGTTVVEARKTGITSDCLVTAEDAPLTVLVGELPLDQSTKTSFWVKSAGEGTVGKLAWSVSEPEYAEFLAITMMSGPDVIDPSMEIELLQNVEMEFTMTLMPTQVARTTVHETLKLNVLVTWGDTMWGTFQVILPAVEGEEEETTETTEAASEEATEPETTQESTEASTETTAAAETLSDDDTQGAPTQSSETTESTGETTESTESTKETTETTESTESTGETVPAEIGMATLRSFAQSEALPVKIVLAPDVTSVKLGLWVEETIRETAEDGTVTESTRMVLSPLPDDTRFSLNGGQSYYMLADGSIVELNLEAVTELPVLMDFSHAKLRQEEKLTLAMEAWAGETLLASCDASTIPDVTELCRTLTHALAQAEAETETTETTETTASDPWQGKILTRDNCLEVVLPLHWWDAQLEYSLDILAVTDYGVLEYRPVALSAGSLSAKRTSYGGVHNLVLQIGDMLPQAGTYRLNMKWKYEDICFAQAQTTFFINYSTLTAYTLGS